MRADCMAPFTEVRELATVREAVPGTGTDEGTWVVSGCFMI